MTQVAPEKTVARPISCASPKTCVIGGIILFAGHVSSQLSLSLPLAIRSPHLEPRSIPKRRAKHSPRESDPSAFRGLGYLVHSITRTNS